MKLASTTKYFTFCWNGHWGRKQPSRYQQEYLNPAQQFFSHTSNNKYALLFQLSKKPTVDEISDNALAARLFGLPLFISVSASTSTGWPYAVIAGNPRAVGRLIETNQNSVFNVMYVKDRNNKTREIPLDRLYRVCHRLEKFSLDCRHCPLDPESGPEGCVITTLHQWCEENNIDPFLLKPTKDGADKLGPEQLEACLEQADSDGFVFVSPRITRECLVRPPPGKVHLVRHWSTHYLNNIEQNREEASARSTKAAQSRAAHRICDSNCFYSNCCERRHNSYRSQAHACQQPYGSENIWWKKNSHVPGPYPEKEVREVYRQWYSSLDTRSIEEITFVVHNAGVRIHHFPHELCLVGMDSNLDCVVFRGVQRKCGTRKFFRYEDALELLQTPCYKHYTRPYLKKPPRLLTEDELLMYAAIRQFQVSSETYGFGYHNAAITNINWYPIDKTFEILVHTGRWRTISSLANLQIPFGLYSTINGFTWFRSKGGPEGVCQVSSPGILP